VQYFYLRTGQGETGTAAQAGGAYGDDVLLSLMPQGAASVVLVDASDAVKRVLKVRSIGRDLGENMHLLCTDATTDDLAKLVGPYGILKRDELKVAVLRGELPAVPTRAMLKDAYATVALGRRRQSLVQVGEAKDLYPLVARVLSKMLASHMGKEDRVTFRGLVGSLSREDAATFREKAGQMLRPAVEGIVRVAARKGITVNNFPGQYPGLCTLWFTEGDEITLSRRAQYAANMPETLSIGEITLTNDWKIEFREKSSVNPDIFAEYLRIGVSGAKLACGCLSVLVSLALGLVAALVLGGQWWWLPAACGGALVMLTVGGAFYLKYKRGALDRRRRGET
jgi:hypothetical protein